MDSFRTSRHVYVTHSPMEIKTLMNWLVSKGYWFDFQKDGAGFCIVCGIAPHDMRDEFPFDIQSDEDACTSPLHKGD